MIKPRLRKPRIRPSRARSTSRSPARLGMAAPRERMTYISASEVALAHDDLAIIELELTFKIEDL